MENNDDNNNIINIKYFFKLNVIPKWFTLSFNSYLLIIY